MGKAKVRKKLEGYKKQLKKHIDKFNEAKERGAIESMNYMATEMKNYINRMDILKKRLMKKK
tara:strand:- start:137 stop:322 length:186 start_codon:yes stop_codon:yes gene_type:complete